MFETAADNASILSIDAGLLIGLLVLQRLRNDIARIPRKVIRRRFNAVKPRA
jgi:hypothetical protein